MPSQPPLFLLALTTTRPPRKQDMATAHDMKNSPTADRGGISDYASEKRSSVDAEDVRFEHGVVRGKVDYSGVSAKTDPREIKLVHKLDRYILVTLSS